MNDYCRIESLKVTNSFFESICLDFSENLNCIMGARGTGKTTLLEFLRYAFDITFTITPEKKKEIQSLLESNLRDGVIEIKVRKKDGVVYKIERTLGSEPIVLNDLGNRIDVDPSSFFPLEIFGQGEIETLAISPEEQLSKLIDGYRGGKLKTITDEINKFKRLLDDNANKQVHFLREKRNIRRSIAQFGDLEDQYKKLQGELDGIKSKELDEIQLEKAKYRDCETEYEVLKNCMDWIELLNSQLSSLKDTLWQWENVFQFPEDYQNANRTVLASLSNSISNKIKQCQGFIKQVEHVLLEMGSDVLSHKQKLKPLHAQQIKRFQTIVSKYKTFQSQTQRLLELQKKLSELKKLKQALIAKEEEIKGLMASRIRIKKQLALSIEERFKERYEIANDLTDHLGSNIKVDVEQNALRNEYHSTLLEILYGSGLKYTSLVEKIVNYYLPDEFASAVRQKDRSSLITALGFDDYRIDNMLSHLTADEGANLFRIDALVVDDRPAISLRIREKGTYHEQFRPAHLLSTGQKCTTILPILLAKGTGPLIIDQPEDNLDNQYIFTTIVQLLSYISAKRQLIFITHNPNIPVLGNAGYNIFLASREDKGYELSSGSIFDVKDEIVEYLEGGEEAFKKREEFYGRDT